MGNCNKVTVITVCYNAAKSIEATMLSVLGQTYGQMEYIIIDGGSMDGPQEIIERVRRETEGAEKRIVWYASEPDKGIYDAMNKGLAHASGDWVNFMNAGDTFADDKVLEDIFGEKPLGKSRQSGQSESSASSNTAIKDEVKVIAGCTINILKDGEETYYPAAPEALAREMMCSHQALFVRLSPEEPWRFDTHYRIAADYNLLHSIYKNFGAQAFLRVDRAVARYECTESFSLKSRIAAKKEYLRIQREWTKTWWWNEWKRLWLGKYK